MRVEQRNFLSKIDINLVVAILALNTIGLFNLYSATHGPNSEDVATLFIQQIVWLTVGWSIFFGVTFIDYMIIQKLSYAFYIFNLGALLFVTFFGKVALGAQRWIDLGFFKYQPSETMKLAVIMVLAKILSNRSIEKGMGLKELWFPLLMVGIPFTLIVEQPDLGTALMIAAISSTLLIFMRIKRSILVTMAVIIAIALPLAWEFVLHDYQKNRVLTFISPNNDPRGSGYNSIQSKIAVGSGQFLGRGFRKGTQSQLEFLPERHTDFIFSVLSEEYGFVGSLITVSLFCILYIIALRIASTAREKYGAILVVGIVGYIFWHMCVNVGMVIGLLPIVGVPLPLLSYGGSSMLTTMLALGIISSVAYRRYIF